jgi:hypothetical protein
MGLERLSLHDSNLESYVRCGTTIELEFDWAKLADLLEHNVSEPIIMGRTTIMLTGVQAEKLIIYEDDQGIMQPLASFDAIDTLELIVLNELSEKTKTLKIAGILTAAAGSQWVEWQLAFSTCTVSWLAFITSTEWHNGLLPPD